NAEKHISRREPLGIGCQQVGRCLGIADRRIGEEVDGGHGWCQLVQHRLHLTRIGSLQTEIRKHHNHFVMSLVWWHVRGLECRASLHPFDDFTAVRSQSGNYRWLAPSSE